MLETVWVECPCCGENFETIVDCSAGNQAYIEDCPVCCQPISFHSEIDAGGELLSLVSRCDND